MALIRAFIAVELPETLKKELAELEAQLKKKVPRL
jgi:2'-5' RNA ligase